MGFFLRKRMRFSEGPVLRRELVIALALKGILLLAIYLLCFGPAHRRPADAAVTAAALLGSNLPMETR
jgi:hypothetical protein